MLPAHSCILESHRNNRSTLGLSELQALILADKSDGWLQSTRVNAYIWIFTLSVIFTRFPSGDPPETSDVQKTTVTEFRFNVLRPFAWPSVSKFLCMLRLPSYVSPRFGWRLSACPSNGYYLALWYLHSWFCIFDPIHVNINASSGYSLLMFWPRA